MDAVQYCLDKAAPLGSNAYYALLWLPPAAKAQVVALLALRQELLDIPAKVSDGQLGLTKLNWWRDEIRRTAAGSAQHLVSMVLQPLLAERADMVAELRRMSDGIELLLQTGRINDDQALQLLCHQLGATPWKLAAQIVATCSPAEAGYAAAIGDGLHLLEMLQQLSHAAQRGLVLAPVSMLQRHGLTVERLAAGDGGAEFAALAAEIGAAVRAHFALARAQLAGRTPRALRFLAAEMKMAEATLGEIERDGLANLQQRRISLTPLRKLWISWKTVRFG